MSHWITRKDLQPNAAMRLFCIPHAGSGSAIYRRWKRHLPSQLDLCPIHLPGREMRLAEPSLEDAAVLTGQLMDAMRLHLDRPYAIFGHSMGALIAYGWAAALAAEGLPAPRVLFLSGRNAAHLPFEHHGLHRLPDTEFVEALQTRFGGVPAGFMQDRELREVFLPILRADLRLVESYRHVTERPLACPVVATAGSEDATVSAEGLAAWQDSTAGAFHAQWFPGGHFYHLGASQNDLLALIAQHLDLPAASR